MRKAFARTGIGRSERNLPAEFAEETPANLSEAGAAHAEHVRQAIATGLEPAEVAARALEGILADDLYIFTHAQMRPLLDKRLARVKAAYDKAERFGEGP